MEKDFIFSIGLLDLIEIATKQACPFLVCNNGQTPA